MGEENAIVVRQKEWTSAQKTRIIALLLHLTQGQSLEKLREEKIALQRYPDRDVLLEEGILAWVSLEAGEILAELTGASQE